MLSRRELLRRSSAAAVGGWAVGCALQAPPQTGALAPAPAVAAGGSAAWAEAGAPRLARVNVAANREIRTIVGLRPFRRSGFRVAVERLDDKLLVHNYGHGGGGVTMSWGTAHIAMEEALEAVGASRLSSAWASPSLDDAPSGGGQDGDRACAVIGCGVIGLTTARLMQRRGWRVTIYARDVPPRTTSNVAGALWQPYSMADPGSEAATYQNQFGRAARLSHRYFQELAGAEYAVRWIETYSLSNAPQPRPWFASGTENLYPEARALAAAEHPFQSPHAIAFKTMLIEPNTYLNALLRDFRIASGRLVVRELVDARDVAAIPEPLIFHCTGLGARQLFGDDEMDPIKGQLTFLLPQPEVDYCVIGDGLYMFPRRDGIVLGGTHERGNWSMEPDADAKRRILDGHRELFGWHATT